MLIAGCRLIAGDHFWLVNLVMTGMALATVYVTYLLVQLVPDDVPEFLRGGMGPGVVLVVGLSARLFVDATHIMTDVPFMMFVMLSLYGMIRAVRHHWGWGVLGAVSLCLATSSRLLGVIFVATSALMLLLHVRDRGVGRRPIVALMLLGLPVLTTAAWFFLVRPLQTEGTIDYVSPLTEGAAQAIDDNKLAEIGQSLARVPEALSGTLVEQRIAKWHANLAPTALIVVGLMVLAWRRKFDLLIFCVPYLAFLVVYTPAAVAARYFLPVMPLLACFLLVGTQALVTWPLRTAERRHRNPGPWRVVATMAMVAVCLAISLPRIGREIYWMRHPDFYAVYDKGEWKDYVECSRYLQERAAGDPAGRALTTELPVVHYLTGLRSPDGFVRSELMKEPPEVFLRYAAQPTCRFVLVPGHGGDWTEAVSAGLAALGSYELPPRQFGSLSLYERRQDAVRSR
jgi:hypothetical protein